MTNKERQLKSSVGWCEKTAQQVLKNNLIQKGTYLVLGATDTGKTSLIASLASHLADKQPVGIVDADIGQSHIGPPAAVGWGVVEKKAKVDFSQLKCSGLSFAGDITPVGHLLQLTESIVKCSEQASKISDITIIDTPGFIHGPAACALWWTVQRMLQPESILAIEQKGELKDMLEGLQHFYTKIEIILSPTTIPSKSAQQRKNYRQKLFNKYFQDSQLYHINLKDVSIQKCIRMRNQNHINRLLSFRDADGNDLSIGLIIQWQKEKDILTVRAPKTDISRVRCLVFGDVTIEINNE